MKTRAIFILLALVASGCLPLQQYDISGTRQYEHLSVVRGYFMEQLSPVQKPKTKTIIANESYAISPKGRKYRIELQPHDFDLSEASPYIRDRIYLLNDSGKRIRRISDGKWGLVLMIESAEGRELREFTAKTWTFNYNPILHGPPN